MIQLLIDRSGKLLELSPGPPDHGRHANNHHSVTRRQKQELRGDELALCVAVNRKIEVDKGVIKTGRLVIRFQDGNQGGRSRVAL